MPADVNAERCGNPIPRAQALREKAQASAFILSVVVCLLFSFAQVLVLSAANNRAAAECDEKINPNEAPVASLMRLPGIGYARAAAIVQYREDARAKDAAGPAFRSCEDLAKVRGLGPKTVEGISGYVEFGQ